MNTTTIRRCKWCVARIGAARHFIDGEWQQVFSIHHLAGDVTFTDGICPECLAAERKKIREARLEAVVPLHGELPDPEQSFVLGVHGEPSLAAGMGKFAALDESMQVTERGDK